MQNFRVSVRAHTMTLILSVIAHSRKEMKDGSLMMTDSSLMINDVSLLT